MLPFVYAPDALIFGISAWGIFLVAGGWVGITFAERMARARGYDVPLLNSAIAWIVFTGMVLGHVVDEVFYHPDVLAQNPLSILYLTRGQSSTGGFTGALLGILMWKYFDVRRRGLVPSITRRPLPLPLLPVGEIIMANFPVTWAITRLGCALVHDHPGRLVPAGSPFAFAALAWPTGPDDGVVHPLGPLRWVYGSTSRYDLGLLECVLLTALALALVPTRRRTMPPGFYTAAVSLAYAPARFALDFLRVTDLPEADRRYASLTFAQWFCVALFVFGAVFVVRSYDARKRLRAGSL
jgi:phosphatidylglycerol---prolipoprotein diacylglyceryl transferase